MQRGHVECIIECPCRVGMLSEHVERHLRANTFNQMLNVNVQSHMRANIMFNQMLSVSVESYGLLHERHTYVAWSAFGGARVGASTGAMHVSSVMTMGDVRGFNGCLRRRAAPVLDVEYLQILTAWCVKRGSWEVWDLIGSITKYVTSKTSPRAPRNMKNKSSD